MCMCMPHGGRQIRWSKFWRFKKIERKQNKNNIVTQMICASLQFVWQRLCLLKCWLFPFRIVFHQEDNAVERDFMRAFKYAYINWMIDFIACDAKKKSLYKQTCIVHKKTIELVWLHWNWFASLFTTHVNGCG